jgi:nucleoporin NUP82
VSSSSSTPQCIAPTRPFFSHVPVSYINALSVFVSTKVDYLEAGAPGASEDLASSFSTVRGPDAFPQSREQKEFARRYRQQHKFVEAMVKQARQQESQGPFDADGKKEDENIDRRVRVKIPKELAKWQPTIQGPFLFQPAPVELGGEGVACDVAYVNYSREVDDGDEATSVGIFVLAFADGKMDVCLEVEKLEAKWDSRGARDVSDLKLSALRRPIDKVRTGRTYRPSSSTKRLISVYSTLSNKTPRSHPKASNRSSRTFSPKITFH